MTRWKCANHVNIWTSGIYNYVLCVCGCVLELVCVYLYMGMCLIALLLLSFMTNKVEYIKVVAKSFLPRFMDHSIVIILADDVVQWRGYCDHFVPIVYVCTVYVCGCVSVYVSTIKRKPLIGTSSKLAQ